MCVYRSNTGTSSRRPNTKLTNVQASYQPHHLLYLLVYDQTRIRVSNELGLPNHGNAEHTVHFDLVEVNTTANIPLEASTRERNRKQLRNTVKHCAFPEIQTVVIQRQSNADRHTIEMPPTLQKMFPYLGHTYDMSYTQVVESMISLKAGRLLGTQFQQALTMFAKSGGESTGISGRCSFITTRT